MTADRHDRLLVATGSCVDAQTSDVRAFDLSFEPAKLHDRSPLCWAVVGHPSGAIAEDGRGMLLMRLDRARARQAAIELTAVRSAGSC